jgi:hypothetical protein
MGNPENKFEFPDGTKDAALRALADLRKTVLSRTHFGNSPRWLAELLFQELITAISREELPPVHSRFDLTEILWTDLKKKNRATDDTTNAIWQKASKKVDEAIRAVAKKLSQDGTNSGEAATLRKQPGLGVANVNFSIGDTVWTLRISGPLHEVSADERSANINLVPAIVGFSDDAGVGFLPRLSPGEKPAASSTVASSLSTTDATVLSRLLDLPTRIADQFSITQPLRAPSETPPPPRDFSGRDTELLELLDAHDKRAFTILGVQGPSGVGKTALGLALVDHLRSRYQSTVFLDLRGNLENPLSPSDVIRHVVHAYQPGRSLPDDVEALRGLYQSTLHDRKAILFFDNVANAAQLQPLLPPSDSLLLVTSLRRFTFPGMYPVPLLPLHPAAAREFLITLAPRCASLADDLAHLCGYFPIALRAAGHTIAEHANVPVDNYVERLRAAQTRLALVDPTTERSVEAVLDVGYGLLPDPIQRRFDALAIFPATFDSAAAAAVWRLPSDVTEESLGTLLRMSFIEYDANTDRYYLHDLLRLFAEAQLRPSVREQLDRRFARHMRHILYVQPWVSTETIVTLNAARRLAMEWPNIEQVYRWVTAKPQGDVFAARFLSTFQWPRALISPMDRSSMLLWIERGTRLSNSRLHRRLVALNIQRKALYHANSREFIAAVRELRRLPALLGTLGCHPDAEPLLLTLQSIAIGDSEAAEIILSFLMPYTRSEAASLIQAQLLATVGVIQGGMGLHAEAVKQLDLAATMARDIDPKGAMAIGLPALACAEALANNDMDLVAAHVDELLLAADGDHRRATTVLCGHLAPTLALRGDSARADRLYDLYVTRSRDSSFIPESSRTLTNTAKAWYSGVVVGICTSGRAAIHEERAIDLLEAARRVAQERNDPESEEYAAVALGLIHASRKSFRKARALLPESLYREITRHGGEGLQTALRRIFSDFTE